MEVRVRRGLSREEHLCRSANFASLHGTVMASRHFGSGTLEKEDGVILSADCGEDLVQGSVFVWFPGGYSPPAPPCALHWMNPEDMGVDSKKKATLRHTIHERR